MACDTVGNGGGIAPRCIAVSGFTSRRYDRRGIAARKFAPGAIPRSTDRSWQQFMALLCMQMRADRQAEPAAFATLERLAADPRLPLDRPALAAVVFDDPVARRAS